MKFGLASTNRNGTLCGILLSLPLVGRVAHCERSETMRRVGVAEEIGSHKAPPRPPLRSADPPHKGEGYVERREINHTARLSSSARSVLSHENPPSFSGARPKWP